MHNAPYVNAIGLAGDDASQLPGVRVDIAQPAAFPTASDRVLRRELQSDMLPFAIEAGATAEQQDERGVKKLCHKPVCTPSDSDGEPVWLK